MVAHNCHINYRLLTSKTNCSHQIQITHIKYKIFDLTVVGHRNIIHVNVNSIFLPFIC